MSFANDMQEFCNTHKFKKIKVRNTEFEYLLCGNRESKRTIVYLVGGAGVPLLYYKHIEAMENDYRILTMYYPQRIRTPEALAEAIALLTWKLGIQKAVWIGSSFGGYMAQLIARKHPEMTDGIGLYSTSGLNAVSMELLKKQYQHLIPMMWLIENFPSYEFLKKIMIPMSIKNVINPDTPQKDAEYLKAVFTWLYDGYTREFDAHMTGLIMNLIDVQPCVRQDFAYLDGRVLIVLPDDDKAFTPELQQELIYTMPNPTVTTLSGGHVATLYQVDSYVEATRKFLESLPESE